MIEYVNIIHGDRREVEQMLNTALKDGWTIISTHVVGERGSVEFAVYLSRAGSKGKP